MYKLIISIMKRLISLTGLAFLLLALLTSSCKKDEVNLLIGTWNVSYQSTITYRNGTNAADTINLFNPGDMVIKIFTGGTGEEWEKGTLHDSFTWVLNGDAINVTLTGQEMVMEMNYTVTDKKLLLIDTITTTVGSDTYVTTMTIIADRATG